MKIITNIWRLLSILLIVSLSFTFTSCGGDDDGLGSGLKGWYIAYEATNSASPSSQAALSSQIQSYCGINNPIYWNEDGSFNSNAYLAGYFTSWVSAIQIVDDNTLIKYSAVLYKQGTGTGTAVYNYKFIFGVGTYYDEDPSYYTYVRTDNKIIVSNGDIYTIVDGGIIEEGTSEVMEKYDPSKIYH